MKPVVSSIVALAIAIAPFAAYAAPTESSHKPTTSKVSKHHKKSDHDTKKSDKKLEPVVHHAHNADVSGSGHSEPKADKSDKSEKADKAIVPASLSSKSHKDKAAHKADKSESKDMPKLPDPKAEKPSKSSGREKSHKASDKKSDDSSDKDGQRERDEDFADLVARIRGKHEGAKDDGKSEPKNADSNKARRISDRQPACSKDPVEVIRGPEIDRFQLTKCDGSVAPLAVEHLSIAIRPGSAARPIAPIAELAKKTGDELAPRVHRIDPGLALRIQALADHFGKPGAPIKMSIVSGMRPTSVGSMHALGRAVDFRIEGQKNEDIVAFCKTLNDTGCGYYPNSSFVHLDVRDPGKGRVSWIDVSGPGETPKYVSSLSTKKDEPLEPASAKETIPDADGMPEVEDNHP